MTRERLVEGRAQPLQLLLATDKDPAGKAFEDMVNNGRFAALAMPVSPLEGGEPIVYDSRVIGAVGVSGVKAGEDAQIARAGVAALT